MFESLYRNLNKLYKFSGYIAAIFLIFVANALDVSGPVAIIVMVSFLGISTCSILFISISGWEDRTSVKDLLNFD